MSIRNTAIVMLAGAGLALVAGSAGAGDQRFVVVGTGGITGVYYPAGGAICRIVNRKKKTHGIRCSVESTKGSVYNVQTIRQGELDFGVVQSDVQYNSFHGKSNFRGDGPFKDLRAVFSLYPEPVTMVARADAGIKSIGDIRGKRVNIGNPGSGNRATWDVLEAAMGWKRSDLKQATGFKTVKQARKLCDNKIDVFFSLVGHPSAYMKEAMSSCAAVLVDVAGPAVGNLVKKYSYFRHATIPAGLYKGNAKPTKTFGVAATLVSSANVPENTVYQVVKGVFENFDGFKKLHPAFRDLTEAEMIRDALSAPLHKGAVKYYKQRGWM